MINYKPYCSNYEDKIPVIETPRVVLTDSQLLEAKVKEDDSVFFHSEDKGCELEDVKILSDAKNKGQKHFFNSKYCRTHDIDICRCGWQIGYHFGSRGGFLNRVKAVHN